MSALFSLNGALIILLLVICTCTYLRQLTAIRPMLDRHRTGFAGVFWKCARIGERLSPYVAVSCFLTAAWMLVM